MVYTILGFILFFIAIRYILIYNKKKKIKLLRENYDRKQKEKTDLLKEQYDTALRSTDRKMALDAGRAYYLALKYPKKLTVQDEQAITNDLSTMNI